MCGIVGVLSAYSNGFTNDEQNIFRDMLFVDTLRGWDSTGVFMVSNVGNVSIRKAALHGPDFIAHDAWKALKAQSWTKGMFMVGHNRAATRGTVNDKNAHPFWVDDKIVLVQNGTYVGSHKHHKDTEVDTEAVAHVIAENADVATALQKINAAYALVWYNTENKTLHLIRNEQRPLFLAKTTDDTILFASEAETIWWAASRNSVKLKGVPKMLEPGELHTFAIQSKRTYEVDTRPLDIKYRAGSFYNESEWAEYYEKGNIGSATRHHFEEPVALLPDPKKPKFPEKTLYDYIQENKFEEFNVTNEIASVIHADYKQPGAKVFVEWLDYLALEPDNINCSRFLVYGEALSPLNENKPSPIIYTILSDTCESDILGVITKHPFYEVVTSATPVTHRVVQHNSSVVTLFTTNMKPVMPATETEDAVH